MIDSNVVTKLEEEDVRERVLDEYESLQSINQSSKLKMMEGKFSNTTFSNNDTQIIHQSIVSFYMSDSSL